MVKIEDKVLEEILKLLEVLQTQGFTGKIEINFRSGNAHHINKFESILIGSKEK